MSNSDFLASLNSDFERFKRELPRDFPAHVRGTYRINLAARYLGRPLPHPIGKGSGQLSLNSGQLETDAEAGLALDRKSTRLNSSHTRISYAVFCLKKKKKKKKKQQKKKKKKKKKNTKKQKKEK